MREHHGASCLKPTLKQSMNVLFNKGCGISHKSTRFRWVLFCCYTCYMLGFGWIQMNYWPIFFTISPLVMSDWCNDMFAPLPMEKSWTILIPASLLWGMQYFVVLDLLICWRVNTWWWQIDIHRWYSLVHYNDIIMSAVGLKSPASRLFTQPFIQCANQRKHQSSVSLAFVQGIHRWIPRTKASDAENIFIWWRHHGKSTVHQFTHAWKVVKMASQYQPAPYVHVMSKYQMKIAHP